MSSIAQVKGAYDIKYLHCMSSPPSLRIADCIIRSFPTINENVKKDEEKHHVAFCEAVRNGPVLILLQYNDGHACKHD
jgi:hypothetical protein